MFGWKPLLVFGGAIVLLCSYIFLFFRVYKLNSKINASMIFYIIITSMITTITYFFNIGLINNLITIITFIGFFLFFGKKSIKESLVIALCFWIYGIFIDFIIMAIVAISGLDTILELLNLEVVRFTSTLLMSVIIILSSFLNIFIKIFRKVLNYFIKLNTGIIYEVLFVLITIILSMIVATHINMINIAIPLAMCNLLLIIFAIIILKNKYIIKNLEEMNNQFLNYNEMFIKADCENRILKHNLTNKLLGIKSVATGKTKSLLETLIIEYNATFSFPKDIGNIPKGLSGLVYEKVYNYNNPEIKFSVINNVYSDPLGDLIPKKYNLFCETFGVLLDNALEASANSEEKAVYLTFEDIADCYKIVIANTFSSDINIDDIGNIGYSSKGKNRGIGLLSIFRRDDVNINIQIINNLYIAQLTIKK